MSQSPVDNRASEANPAYHQGWSELTRLVESGGSWSGRERNCCFLNTGQQRFADISAVSGLDFIDDSRAVGATDWDGDGDLDLWLANRTGPRLRFLRNNSDRSSHFFAVRLAGDHSNRDAIGARLELHLDTTPPRVLVRTVGAGDAFMSQSSKWVHFGLGDQSKILRLVVHWPASDLQTYDALEADRRYVIVEGQQPRRWTQAIPAAGAALAAEAQPVANPPAGPVAPAATSSAARLVLTEPIPAPRLAAQGFDGQPLPLDQDRNALLVNLWATWCIPCLAELSELGRHEVELRQAGLTVVALSVDGMRGDQQSSRADAQAMVERLKLPLTTGMANPELLDKLDVFQDTVLKMATKIDESSSFPIPTSVLIDRSGRVVTIYQGAVAVDQLLQDCRELRAADAGGSRLPFPGRWFLPPRDSAGVLARFADRFLRRGYADESQRYAGLAADLAARDSGNRQTRMRVADVYNDLGTVFDRQGELTAAEEAFLAALRNNPRSAKARTNLGNVFQRRGQPDEARQQYLTALLIEPNQLQAHINVGSIYFAEQNLAAAVTHFRRAIAIDPRFPPAHNLLGLAVANQGDLRAADAHFQQALRLDPNYHEARQNMARLRAAMAGGR